MRESGDTELGVNNQTVDQINRVISIRRHYRSSRRRCSPRNPTASHRGFQVLDSRLFAAVGRRRSYDLSDFPGFPGRSTSLSMIADGDVVIPEPGTYALLASGIALLVAIRSKRELIR